MTRKLADPAAALSAARDLMPRLAGRAAEHDRVGRFPEADFADLRGAGLLGLMVPQRLGGAGAGFADYAEVAMALAAGNGATALIFNMHASVTGALAGTPGEMARLLGVPESYFEMRDRVLAAAAEGSHYAVAMSERGAGSRLSALTTAYEPVEGGYRITGAKTFVSGAGHADGYLVAARHGEAISHFLVPAGAGVTVEETWDSLGMRATGSHDLHLDTVVPADALLGGMEDLVLVLAQVMPQWLVASYAAVYVGVAQSALDAAVVHVTERKLVSAAGGPGPAGTGRRRGRRRPADGAGGGPAGRCRARRAGHEPLGVAGQADRRADRHGRRRLDAGGGRDVGVAARPSAGADLPGRPVRLAAAGDE